MGSPETQREEACEETNENQDGREVGGGRLVHCWRRCLRRRRSGGEREPARESTRQPQVPLRGRDREFTALGLQQFQDAGATLEMVPFRVVPGQSVARGADQRAQAPGRRLQGRRQSQRLRVVRFQRRHKPADRPDPHVHRQEVFDHHGGCGLRHRPQRRHRGRIQGRDSGCDHFELGHKPLRHQRRFQLRALGLRHGVGDREGSRRQGQRPDGRGHRRRPDRGARAGRRGKGVQGNRDQASAVGQRQLDRQRHQDCRAAGAGDHAAKNRCCLDDGQRVLAWWRRTSPRPSGRSR